MQPLRPEGLSDMDLLLQLPAVLVVVHRLTDDLPDLPGSLLRHILGGEHLCHGGIQGHPPGLAVVPKRGVQIVAVMEQHHHRHSLLLHQLGQGVRQDRRGPGWGVAGLGIHAQNIAVVPQNLFHGTEQRHIRGELPLAQAAQPLHQERAAVIAVNRGNVIDRMGPGGDGTELEVNKIHVVGQQQVWGLQPLHIDLLNPVILPDHADAAYCPQDRGEQQALLQRRLCGVIPLERAVIDIDGFHTNVPPLSPGLCPDGFYFPVYHRVGQKANPYFGIPPPKEWAVIRLERSGGCPPDKPRRQSAPSKRCFADTTGWFHGCPAQRCTPVSSPDLM